MENILQPETIKLSRWVRFESWWDAISKRKYICKKFCLEIGIDYPPRNISKIKKPRKFLIDTQRIKSLGEKRDRILKNYYDRYAVIEKDLLEEISQNLNELKDFEKRLTDEEKYLTTIKQSLKQIKDNTKYITRQHRIHTTQIRIQQLKEDCKNITSTINDNQKDLYKNAENFFTQKKIIEDVFEQHMEKYVFSVTKKVQTSINFTNFEYITPPYSDVVCEAIDDVSKMLRKEQNRGKKEKK